jgi:glycosyltransferase involved in cell wall biosynthesis/GT2 family glycosyltransferase
MPFRERPLDWTRGAGRPRGERANAVDVVIPVYGAEAELGRCLESVERETDLARHRLLLVLDGPQDEAVERHVARFPAAEVLRNDVRRGFVESVNRGMRASPRDVVLLNSDTVVTPRWLEKLIDAAASSGDAGTVTPLSNHATLCSVPRAFEENLLPIGFDAASFAALVERVSRRDYPRLPTGVGVCLYIRRALLDEIGFFDAEHFGLGYGEENDFCMRALSRGWVHLADDATFIEHAGHRSFGASRASLQRVAAKTLARLHPAYMPTIAAFMREDPLAPARERIIEALRTRTPVQKPRAPRRVLHVIHGWPPFQHAGTELYAYWLVRRQLRWREVSVFARMADPARAQGEAVELSDDGARVRFVTNNFAQRDPFARNALRDRTFERAFEHFLDEERPKLVHIHHLAGHAFSLARIARRRGIPIVYQIQDWWSLCARVNLFHASGQRCSGPGLSKCAACAPLTRIAPASLWNRALHLVRRRTARAALSVADAYVMGSRFIRDDYARAGLLSKETPVFVLPYGVDIERGGERKPRSGPLRFGFVGSILPHKGLHVALDAFRAIDPALATLHAWGNPNASADYTSMLRERGGASLMLEGTFAEDEKPRIFASIDALLVPSIGLESFGLAAREAMARGVPVIAANDGALTELFGADGAGGMLFPNGDAAALEVILRSVIARPELLDEWAARIPRPKSVDEHAEEIESVYERVLAVRTAGVPPAGVAASRAATRSGRRDGTPPAGEDAGGPPDGEGS